MEAPTLQLNKTYWLWYDGNKHVDVVYHGCVVETNSYVFKVTTYSDIFEYKNISFEPGEVMILGIDNVNESIRNNFITKEPTLENMGYTVPQLIDMTNSGFTKEEQWAFDLLMQAHDAFINLPQQHPDEHRIWADAIHQQQSLFGLRTLRRIYPNQWASFIRGNTNDGEEKWHQINPLENGK